jgi:glycosyltransferase involved in cell wall biosynthesis
MSDHPPKVSIAIPVYNGAPHLGAAIASVLNQSCADFELIICDDHSTDASPQIAASFTDSRIRHLRNERNLGFGGNWNRCLAEARGGYIKLMPQDDLLDPECLARQSAVLDRDTEARIALVFCARSIIGPTGRPLMTRRFAGPARMTGDEAARRTARSGTNPIGEPGAVLFRRSAARAAGAFNGARPFVIDIDYWLRLLKHGDAAYIQEALASFRVSPGSQSVKMARRQSEEFMAFLDDINRTGLYRLSRADMRIGKLAAAANAVGRSLFYRLVLR